jgi:hypothetical protein
MSQVFSPRAGLYVLLAVIALMLMTGGAVAGWRTLTASPHALDEAVNQPVPFSHEHHVGQLGLDCRYCHSTVETSAHAGMPPVSTCMTCHSQLYTDQPMLLPLVRSWQTHVPLQWNRVNQLPDFVYFNHSIHVAKGVGCVSCHGRVDRMPLMRRTASLSMHWCLQCHRAPQKYLRPRSHVYDMAWKPAHQKSLGLALIRRYDIHASRLADCSVCHR